MPVSNGKLSTQRVAGPISGVPRSLPFCGNFQLIDDKLYVELLSGSIKLSGELKLEGVSAGQLLLLIGHPIPASRIGIVNPSAA